jgi:hypothetical protein
MGVNPGLDMDLKGKKVSVGDTFGGIVVTWAGQISNRIWEDLKQLAFHVEC